MHFARSSTALHPARWPCALWRWLGALWRWGHVIWVCRVAAASVAAGGILLVYTEQARDLFADLGVTPTQWVVFFILVFCWALIVHAEGRRALQHDDWVPESHAGKFSEKCPGGLSEKCPSRLSYDRRLALQKEYWYQALWLPRLLSLVVFLFAGISIFLTYHNLSPAEAGLPEAAQAVTLAKYLFGATIAVALLYISLMIWERWVYKNKDWIVPTPPDDPPEWRREPPLLAGTAPSWPV